VDSRCPGTIAPAVWDQLTRAKSLNALVEGGGDPILFADDRMRGYHIDA
jgi:hypothetical protein